MITPGFTICPYCAEEIRAGAKKCKHCGEWLDGSTPAVTAQPSKSQQWETCEIKAETGDYHTLPDTYDWRLWAEGVGPKGRYTASISRKWFIDGRTDTDTPRVSNEATTLLDELVAELVGQGWEPEPTRGKYWFSYRFRRPWDEDKYRSSVVKASALEDSVVGKKGKGIGCWGIGLIIVGVILLISLLGSLNG